MSISVHIQPGFSSGGDTYDIFFWRRFDESSQVAHFNVEGSLSWEKVGEMERANAPTMRLPGPVARSLFPALVKACQLDGRFPLDSEATLRGKLEATEFHLSDMRLLLMKEWRVPALQFKEKR